jgi:hypothetical protein
MTSLIARDKTEAKKKGLMALGAWGGSAFLLTVGWTFTGIAAAGGAAYLTWKWFMYRAKRGMRF